jgi:hypothetical protein
MGDFSVFTGAVYLLAFLPLSRTGHHTPRPTLRLPCLCHIQIWYNIMLGLGGEPLIERLRAQTTSTKIPVVASPTYRVLYPIKISGVGTNFGLLLHLLPGPKEQRELELNKETKQLARFLRSF